MKIYRVTDPEFSAYGRVVSLETSSVLEVADRIALPETGSSYVPSREELEALPIGKTIQNELFGGVDAQIGYCWGYNTTLNALEWHTCSEINIAVQDLILLLGDLRDVQNGRYDSAKIKAFRLNRGETIEVYATTLHFCPIQTAKTGFGCVVGLVKGTNTKLEQKAADPLLWAKNKWLIAHEDNKPLVERGAFAGIYGENYTL